MKKLLVVLIYICYNKHMSILGDIKTASDLGKIGTGKFMWSACIDCGKARWAILHGGIPQHLRCYPCALKIRSQLGERNPQWKGGRIKAPGGYIAIRLYPSDFFYPTATLSNHRYALEHRLVMAKHLGRNLLPFEKIHHKNGIRDDNRLLNLELTMNGAHSRNHSKGYRDGYHKGYQDGVTQALEESRSNH